LSTFAFGQTGQAAAPPARRDQDRVILARRDQGRVILQAANLTKVYRTGGEAYPAVRGVDLESARASSR